MVYLPITLVYHCFDALCFTRVKFAAKHIKQSDVWFLIKNELTVFLHVYVSGLAIARELWKDISKNSMMFLRVKFVGKYLKKETD